MQFLDELKKRNVTRIAALYLVASWLIVQVGDLVFGAFEAPSWAIRLLIVVLLLGFPIALVLSWVFELTSDGLVRESDVGHRTVRRLSGQRVYALIGAMLALVVLTIVVNRTLLDTRPDDYSIAVLPFINISDDPANDFFSDGLSEELLNLLARIPELRVTARTSSFSFKNKALDLPTIGRLLNVAHVLEGSVRMSGTKLRITAQLINVENGFHIWSQTYDREFDDIFVVQDDISEAVVAALRVSILGEVPRARVTRPEAFTAFLNALHFYQQRTKDGYANAVIYAQQAIDLDTEYAPAWNLLSATYSNQVIRGELPYDAGHEMAMHAVERALGIDPDYALAYSARAWIAMNFERDYAGAATLFRRAAQLDPDNPTILSNRAVLANRLGRMEEALEMQRRGLTLNPISTTGYSNLSDFLARAHRPNEAIEAARKAIELVPGNTVARINLALAHLLAEQPLRAIEAVDKVDGKLYRLLVRALAYHSLNRTPESDVALAQITEQYGDTSAFQIAAVYAWRNDVDTAFEWLNRAVDEEQPTSGIRNEPFLRNLHDDPRWEALLSRLGLSDEQIAFINAA